MMPLMHRPATRLLSTAVLMLVPLILAHATSFRSNLPAPVLAKASAGVSAGLA